MEHLKASDPHYEEVNRLQNMLVVLRNIRISKLRGKGFVAGQLMDMDVAEAELNAIETNVIKALEGKLDEVQIASLEEVYGKTIRGLNIKE